MTPTECVDLVEFIAGRCPAMRMQPNTPHTWYLDLVEFDLTDALEAARTASLDQTFVGIGDLVRECRVIVRHRQGVQRLAELEAEIAAETTAELHARPVQALTVGRHVPVDDEVRADRRQMLRQAAHSRRAAVAADNQAAAEHRSRVAAALAELHPEAS